jgi:hypothetical protein
MSGVRPAERHPRLAATGRGAAHAFWGLAFAVIVAYVFVVGLGAIGTEEVAWLTIGVIVLALLWGVRAALRFRDSHRAPPDQSLARQQPQERRGSSR